jgi:hypothetical protein
MKLLKPTLLAAALLAGSTAASAQTHWSGLGVVEDVRPTTINISPRRWANGYQLALRMDNGAQQFVTQDHPGFRPGDRVQVTRDGQVFGVADRAPAPVVGNVLSPLPPVVSAPPPPPYPPVVGNVLSGSAPHSAFAPVLPLRSGSGVIEAVVVDTPPGSGNPIRYTARMDDGSFQQFTFPDGRFRVGERVRITNEGYVMHS